MVKCTKCGETFKLKGKEARLPPAALEGEMECPKCGFGGEYSRGKIVEGFWDK